MAVIRLDLAEHMQSDSDEPELMVVFTNVSGWRLKSPYHHLWNDPGCPASLLKIHPWDIPSQPGNVELPNCLRNEILLSFPTTTISMAQLQMNIFQKRGNA